MTDWNQTTLYIAIGAYAVDCEGWDRSGRETRLDKSFEIEGTQAETVSKAVGYARGVRTMSKLLGGAVPFSQSCGDGENQAESVEVVAYRNQENGTVRCTISGAEWFSVFVAETFDPEPQAMHDHEEEEFDSVEDAQEYALALARRLGVDVFDWTQAECEE